MIGREIREREREIRRRSLLSDKAEVPRQPLCLLLLYSALRRQIALCTVTGSATTTTTSSRSSDGDRDRNNHEEKQGTTQ